jgi:hypothetical protein
VLLAVRTRETTRSSILARRTGLVVFFMVVFLVG